jgi:hypothetical protein
MASLLYCFAAVNSIAMQGYTPGLDACELPGLVSEALRWHHELQLYTAVTFPDVRGYTPGLDVCELPGLVDLSAVRYAGVMHLTRITHFDFPFAAGLHPRA